MTKTIIWDFDDVLFETLRYWTVWYGHEPGKHILYQNIIDNPPLLAAGITYDEYRISMDAFRTSDFARSLKPASDLLEWFETYGNRFMHILLTARPLSAMASASAWVYTYFGRWIHTISHISSPRPGDRIHNHFANKGEWINHFDPEGYYLDDSPSHIASVLSPRIKPFLVSQPWNNSHLQLRVILQQIVQENEL